MYINFTYILYTHLYVIYTSTYIHARVIMVCLIKFKASVELQEITLAPSFRLKDLLHFP